MSTKKDKLQDNTFENDSVANFDEVMHEKESQLNDNIEVDNVNNDYNDNDSALNQKNDNKQSDIPFAWQYKLTINDKTVKQTKDFKKMMQQAQERENMMPIIKPD